MNPHAKEAWKVTKSGLIGEYTVEPRTFRIKECCCCPTIVD